MNFDEDWLRAHYAKLGKPLPAEVSGRNARKMGKSAQKTGESAQEMGENAQKRSKYGNRRTEYKGMVFDSQHEANEYASLELQVRAGAIRAVLRQVPFLLPGDVRYIADFVVLNVDGTYTVYDAKSEATRNNQVYRIKKKQMRNCLGIEIQEV